MYMFWPAPEKPRSARPWMRAFASVSAFALLTSCS
jgi:hypothetical protein